MKRNLLIIGAFVLVAWGIKTFAGWPAPSGSADIPAFASDAGQIDTLSSSNVFVNGTVFTDGLLISSNQWNDPYPAAFAEGGNLYRSSNGIPHVIIFLDSATNIYRLIP